MPAPDAPLFDLTLAGTHTLSVGWFEAYVGLGVLAVAWSYALLAPMSVMPVERGVFQMLWPERLALGLPRPVAFLLKFEPKQVLLKSRYWTRFVAEHEVSYKHHRHVHAAMFLPARFLALIVLSSGLLFAIFSTLHALSVRSLAIGLGGGAVFVLLICPTLVTVLAARFRWRRRVPFEVAWIHEVKAVLSKHRRAATLGMLEQREVLTDLGDPEYVLARRHHNSPSGSSGEMASARWAARTEPLLESAAAFEGRASVSAPQVWAWLGTYVDQASKLIQQDVPKTRVSSLKPARRSKYSADKAGLVLLAMLLVIFALLAAGALLISGIATIGGIRSSIGPWLTSLSSLAAGTGIVMTVIRQLSRGSASLS